MKPNALALALVSLAATACGAETLPETPPAKEGRETTFVASRKGEVPAAPSDASWALKAANRASLPECSPETEGRLAWVADEKAAVACDGTEWASLDLKGAKGDRGERGEKGEKGDSGEKGADGLAGADGKDGLDGAPGERGERGEKGERGEQGLAGTNGVDGQDGADAPTTLSSSYVRLLLPISHVNALTGSMYSGTSWQGNAFVELEVRAMSNGKTCLRGIGGIHQIVAPYDTFRATVLETCASGDVRFPVVWHAQHGYSVVRKADGTWSAQAGAWNLGGSGAVWSTAFVPSSTTYSTPAP